MSGTGTLWPRGFKPATLTISNEKVRLTRGDGVILLSDIPTKAVVINVANAPRGIWIEFENKRTYIRPKLSHNAIQVIFGRIFALACFFALWLFLANVLHIDAMFALWVAALVWALAFRTNVWQKLLGNDPSKTKNIVEMFQKSGTESKLDTEELLRHASNENPKNDIRNVSFEVMWWIMMPIVIITGIALWWDAISPHTGDYREEPAQIASIIIVLLLYIPLHLWLRPKLKTSFLRTTHETYNVSDSLIAPVANLGMPENGKIVNQPISKTFPKYFRQSIRTNLWILLILGIIFVLPITIALIR